MVLASPVDAQTSTDAVESAMPGMEGAAGEDAMAMSGRYGPYPMEREASGTSWQPDTTPMDAIHGMADSWTTMLHGEANTVVDHQGGPRGARETFSEGMLMYMAQRSLGPGTWGILVMGSIDPTMGKAGYPLLFGSGETANGKTPLIDRQHPHDLISELASSYSLPLTPQASVFGYAGLPGEPALGPPAFMHRFSGADNPEAPITHHWLDSTHVTFGVVTLGGVWDDVKLEASSFNGREPDEFRYNIETRPFDSHAARLSWNPTAALSLQVSQGYLASPEQLAPDQSVERRTASVIFQTSLDRMVWGSTLAWGQNRRSGSAASNAVLLESTLRIRERYTIFGRAEWLGNDELFAPGSRYAGDVFKVGKLSVGAIDDFYHAGPVAFGVGALVSRYAHRAVLDPVYGNPTSWMVFLRAKLTG